MIETLAHHSGQTVEKIERDIDRDFILRGHDAVEYGLVDRVIESRQLVPVAASPNGSAPKRAPFHHLDLYDDPAVPVLASIPSPDNGVIDIGPIPLHAYDLLLAIGAHGGVDRRAAVGARGFDGKTFSDMAVWIVVGGVVGARVYHVISDYQLFTDDWLRAFQIWKGGLSIWGVLAGGVIAVIVLTRIKHVETLRSWIASHPGCSPPRPSVAGAATSTRSSSAARPICRGDSRSRRGSARPGTST